MTMSKNPNSYGHIKAVLDAAVSAGGGAYTLPSAAEAIKWRQEAYRYRSMLSEIGPTPYDDLLLSLVENKIRIVVKTFTGTFTTEDGTIINLTKPAHIPDELEQAALDFANSLDSLELDLENDS